MMTPTLLRQLAIATALSLCFQYVAHAEPAGTLSLGEVVQQAREQRQDIAAARARASAAQARPAIVSALEDPMLTPAIDHYPFDAMEDSTAMTDTPAGEDGMDDAPASAQPTTTDTNSRRYDWSIAIEQKFPFSGVLGHRREAAEADILKANADVDTKLLDVSFEAVSAFYMLQERRRMADIAAQQNHLTEQLLGAATARYSAGQGEQTDILRVETELARLTAREQALQADIRAASRMLNTSMGRAPDTPIPALIGPALDRPLPDEHDTQTRARQQRPELRVGAAEITRADADKKAMQAMYAPMGMVKVGYASTMAEGKGAMLMVGVSLPIWREKLHAGVAEATSMQQMAHADLAAMRQMIEGEALAAREQLNAARIQYLALRDNVVPRAQRVISPALSAYAAGKGSLSGVIDATQAFQDVQQEAVMAESALGIAWARLQRMTGTTWETGTAWN